MSAIVATVGYEQFGLRLPQYVILGEPAEHMGILWYCDPCGLS